MSVGTNIKRLRIDAGLTQEELAQSLGVARSTVTQWERGWTQPRMGMVHKLAVFFGTTNSVIVQEEDREPNTVGVAAAASIPIDAAPGNHSLSDQQELAVPPFIFDEHPHARCVIVEDDSIDRVLPKGFAAVYDPKLRLQNGRIVVARMDGELLLRRWHQGSSAVMLVADSHTHYEDIVLEGSDEVAVLGVVFYAQAAHELV